MKRVVILTGNHLRHDYMRMAVALCDGVDVLRSYCEVKPDVILKDEQSQLAKNHIIDRHKSEIDFFEKFVQEKDDFSNPLQINTGGINEANVVEEIIQLKPDVLIAYGCSLVKSELLQHFKGRFLNVHLGLSPYYRGTATNFWPLVNDEPEFVGATFMHIDEGVDTGEVIHQIRADIYVGDDVHKIGNRLITQIPEIYCSIIRKIDSIKAQPQMPLKRKGYVYKRKDFSEEATKKLYENFRTGMVDKYVQEKDSRLSLAPIVINPLLV